MKFSFVGLKHFFHKHESSLTAVTLVGGFIFDFLTLNRVDLFWDNFFIVLYIFIAGISIIVINLFEEGKLRGGIIEKIYEFLPFTLQFCFGGLFSAFSIFYSKSASLFTSGIFVAILFTLLVGNEFFKKRYERLVFQMAVYFLAIFSFLIILLPVLTKTMGDDTFMLSGVFSLIFIGIFILFLSEFSPLRYEQNRLYLNFTIASLFIVINVLYFANIIPPVPLSMKMGEVYHEVVKNSDGTYMAISEVDNRWYKKFLRNIIHLDNSGSVYVFSSVFAPTDLKVNIIHDWQYYSEPEDKWISVTKIPFTILGGRGNGYRIYSKKDNIFPGKWRVDVETESGQVVGRIRFDVKIGSPRDGLEIVKL